VSRGAQQRYELAPVGGRADGDYTLRANTRDLLALLDALDLEDALVAGWSYGGVMAMDAAVLDDARIAAIALIASGGPSSDEDTPPEAGTAVRLFYSIPVLRWRSWVPPLSRGLMSVLSEQAFSGGPQPDWWLPTLRANFSRWETVLSYRGEILAPIETELRLDAIAVPTVVMHGDDDRLAPVAIGRYLAERIPGAAYQELEGASHMLPVTHAEALADALLAMVAPAGTTAAPAGGDEAAEETRAAPSPGR
jgi:pimeloyl-ACP methyl ester carboxylesterase